MIKRVINSLWVLPWVMVFEDSLQVLSSSLWWFSPSAVSDSLGSRELQHTGSACPSLSPGVCSNSCPLGIILANLLGAQCAAPPSLPPRAAAGGSLHWPSFGIESSSVVMMWVVAVSVNGGILHLAMIVNEPSPGTRGWPACWRTNPAWTLAWQNLFIGKDRKRLNE